MPSPCTVCGHDERERIDSEIAQGGASQRAIAARYGLSKDAVRRHTAHVSASLARVVSERETAGARSALDRLEELYVEARAVLESARGEGKAGLSLQAIRELRGLVETLAKITGELDDKPTVQVLNVSSNPEWLRVRDVLLSSLAPYPEVGQVVFSRLDELEVGP